MKRQSMPSMKEGGVNVTPLIDVVMVLIVFFMLVAKIGVSRGSDPDIRLPSTILGKRMESLSNTLTLNVHWNKNGDDPLVNALVDGKNRSMDLNRRTHAGADDELARVLKAFHAQFKEKATVIIRGDSEMPYTQLETVLLDCANAGISTVSYETKQGSDPMLKVASAR